VRLQGRRVNATGASLGASILANTDGRTTLRFKRIA
jgi:predicted alpha/beta-fold hydrolase